LGRREKKVYDKADRKVCGIERELSEIEGEK
jgi:hypothetical protein